MDNNEVLRKLPKIDQVLNDQRLVAVFEDVPREVVVDAVRKSVDEMRKDMLAGKETDAESIFERVEKLVKKTGTKSLRRVINATGVIIHTNLGRSVLPEAACRNVSFVSTGYSSLEYNLKKGTRGSRHDHIEPLIKRITGAEAGMAVNNNAAATLLCLAAISGEKETIVSRGELVEIGGSFRIPDIMDISRARLVEVGTTNKTKIDDYKKALTRDSAMILKVHKSNYAIVGFTDETELEELVGLGKKAGLPVAYDMGSGLIADLSEYGIREANVENVLKTGIDMVFFSGDKLLGGPQAGIIAGRKKYIDKMKEHPLARALRIDKMTAAAMEAVLYEYLDEENAVKKIPVLKMITDSEKELEKKAKKCAEKIKEALKENEGFHISVQPSENRIGGGTTPLTILPGFAVVIGHNEITPEKTEKSLRANSIPVIARIHKESVNIEMRTVTEEETDIIAETLKSIYGGEDE